MFYLFVVVHCFCSAVFGYYIQDDYVNLTGHDPACFKGASDGVVSCHERTGFISTEKLRGFCCLQV